jgi:Zn-dependent peptidase ImmA (M78 family)
VKINEEAKLKNPITEKDLFQSEIKASLLKRIDKIFKKGINYYIDPKNVEDSKEESIFFRKDNFNAELNLGAKQIVNHFEEEKISLSTLAILSDFKTKRTIPIYSIHDNPQDIAIELRKILYPEFNRTLKEFLRALINSFSEYNIVVFEFVETWNKREKANINGFYLNPNVIVLKRQQKAFRREIFTLIHELGHYLLNEEEIDDSISEEISSQKDLNKVEKWCNDFAYYFLVGEYSSTMNNLPNAGPENDYHFDLIETISNHTNLSKIALFTRLLLTNKITPYYYKLVKEDLHNAHQEKLREEERKRELEKLDGRASRGSVPKPIHSPLFVKTVQSAFYEGVIGEAEFCKRLNVKADKIDKYLL